MRRRVVYSSGWPLKRIKTRGDSVWRLVVIKARKHLLAGTAVHLLALWYSHHSLYAWDELRGGIPPSRSTGKYSLLLTFALGLALLVSRRLDRKIVTETHQPCENPWGWDLASRVLLRCEKTQEEFNSLVHKDSRQCEIKTAFYNISYFLLFILPAMTIV